MLVIPNVISAANDGNIDYVITLVENKGVNIVDYDKRSALYLAATEGNYDIVKYLVEKGTNVDVKDRWRNTLYHEVHKHIEESDDFRNICALLIKKMMIMIIIN